MIKNGRLHGQVLALDLCCLLCYSPLVLFSNAKLYSDASPLNSNSSSIGRPRNLDKSLLRNAVVYAKATDVAGMAETDPTPASE